MFERTQHKFGFVRQGEKVKFEYTFKNTGTDPVSISDIQVECSCTEVEIPKEPVKSGEGASIKILFDTKSAIDRQDRTAVVISNAKNSPTVLRFKGVVLKPKNKK